MRNVLKKLEDMGQLDNTIVVFTTDNGAETATFPDGGITPFKGQKGGSWEVGYRAPLVVRWAGVIKPGTVKNQLFAALDWLPTFVDIAGGPKGDGLKQQIEAGQYGHWRNGGSIFLGQAVWHVDQDRYCDSRTSAWLALLFAR
jgi:arylsulfatase A-like enzyme